jgi:tRNA-dihydrouridine synthase B
MSLYKSLQIGPISTSGNLYLAPMAGYTDKAFRKICVEHEASFAFTEMASAEALWRSDAPRTIEIMEPYPEEKILAIQIFAGNLEAIEKCFPKILAMKPQIIDLNVGCPVSKVNKSGGGSALMKVPHKLYSMLKFMRDHTPVESAVTVKFRSGWSENEKNFLEIADLALKAGLNMLSMHPRTRSQAYTGKADWSLLTTLKKTFPQATICASGDLNSPENIKQMLEETGVDGAMIARGAMGNPFIFKQAKEFLSTGNYTPTTLEECMKVALAHYNLCASLYTERYALNEMKKQISSYAKGHSGVAEFRRSAVLVQSSQELRKLFEQFFTNNRPR